MSYVLKRVSQSEKGTFGVLLRGDTPLCVTLEPPWLNNQVGKSCIPSGVYEVHPHSGAKFKDVWEIEVPGRDAILFHAGNSLQDTTGCVLVGRSFNSHTIRESQNALEYLRAALPDNFKLQVVSVCGMLQNKETFFDKLIKLFKGE